MLTIFDFSRKCCMKTGFYSNFQAFRKKKKKEKISKEKMYTLSDRRTLYRSVILDNLVIVTNYIIIVWFLCLMAYQPFYVI